MEGKTVEKLAIDTLAEYFPNLKSQISNLKTITPKDLEETYGLTEGDLNHGQLMLDQFLFMRPIPGWSNHKTPIDNLVSLRKRRPRRRRGQRRGGTECGESSEVKSAK